MCGIIAYTGRQQALPVLLDGLRRLAYRGYDSAGVGITYRRRIRITKSAGKLNSLEQALPETVKGTCGVGHTRWATHGAPTQENAHPHTDANQSLALVHNGIIENAEQLRAVLLSDGVEFRSETDTEVLAHYLAKLMAQESTGLLEAMRQLAQKVVGTYGIAVTSVAHPEQVVLARNGSPVIIGIGQDEMLAASDQAALSRYTRDIVHLDDGELALLTPDGFEVTTLDATVKTKSSTTLIGDIENYDKGGHPSYLYKEITDQPDTVRRTISGRVDRQFNTTKLGGLNLEARDLLAAKRIKILGCGSALYAGVAGAQMIESLSRVPADAEAAAEFRYRNPVIEPDTLYMVVSQSGETFDTLAATREIQRKGGFVLGVVNSVGSTIAREVDGGIYMHAGPEVSVASTKAYTAMLTVFMLFAVMLGRTRDISPQRGAALLDAIEAIPEGIQDVLALETQIAKAAGEYRTAHSAFYVGRTTAWPVAMEGAQKLKEISYIHAEAYAASELKHGPLALVTAQTPCVVIVPDNELLSKSIASLEEIHARKAPVIVVTDADDERIRTLATHVIKTPAADPVVQGLLSGIALQLFAYHSAVALGRDVDQPRNLAKSVTVE
jgi:glucosamine--fructose-6-phosphate aminotransferase (isomerizing)